MYLVSRVSSPPGRNHIPPRWVSHDHSQIVDVYSHDRAIAFCINSSSHDASLAQEEHICNRTEIALGSDQYLVSNGLYRSGAE